MMKILSMMLLLSAWFTQFLSAQAPDVCLIAAHPAAAEHFTKFIEVLEDKKISWQVFAADVAEQVLKQKKIPYKKISIWTHKSLKELSPEECSSIAKVTAKACKKAKVIVTDVSEEFVVYLHRELSAISSAKRYVYYDNPESYVPGGYSQIFEELLATDPYGVMFANKHLADVPLYGDQLEILDFGKTHKVGLGFYTMDDVEHIKRLVHDKTALREKLFQQLGIRDEQQKLLVYLGGANKVYYNQAFPFFLQAIENSLNDPFFENILLLLQQHPRAKQEGSLDLYELLARGFPFQIFLSPMTTLEVIGCADLIYYYQTSLSPKILLARRPLVQVAHEVFEDVGIRLQQVDGINDPKKFVPYSLKALARTADEEELKKLQEALGYDPLWKSTWIQCIVSG